MCLSDKKNGVCFVHNLGRDRTRWLIFVCVSDRLSVYLIACCLSVQKCCVRPSVFLARARGCNDNASNDHAEDHNNEIMITKK